MDSFISYIPLIIGWLLGILSSLLVNLINKKIQKKEIKRGIISEIKDLQLRLIGTHFLTTLETKAYNEDWAIWFKPFFNRLVNSNEMNYVIDLKKDKDVLIKMTNAEFFTLCTISHNYKKSEYIISNQTFSKINLPFVDSNYHSISLFDEKFQLLITKLKHDICLLNHFYEQIWFYHSKTFDKLSNDNHMIIVGNINQIIPRICRMSMALIKLTEDILYK